MELQMAMAGDRSRGDGRQQQRDEADEIKPRLIADPGRRMRARGAGEAAFGVRGVVEPLPVPAMQRVLSVDALRGLAMICIIGADSLAHAIAEMLAGKSPALAAIGAALAAQFDHPEWNGIRLYDILFPTFIFVMGVAIVFSLTRQVERSGRAAAYKRIMRRTLVLFALGLIYNGGVSEHWPEVRILGVLQRIAICYLAGSVLFLNVRPRVMAGVLVTLLVGYWALMTFVPVPGIGAGVFEPGANLANWIDAHYLPGHKWNDTWDPEGLLSTLPAIATCLLGVFAGLLLKDERPSPQQKSLWLIGAGVAMVALGALWGLQFPVNKHIWTSSFVLVAGGSSAFLLGVLHQAVDVWGVRGVAMPFVWIGASAITLYLVNDIADVGTFEDMATRVVGGDVGTFLDTYLTAGAGHFASAALGLAIAVALAHFLYRRKIFLRI
jgi:predicted acyltransferase